jgi:putative hemolysin
MASNAITQVYAPAPPPQGFNEPILRSGAYCVRLATSSEDKCAALRLRFLVFNLELNEGLESAYTTGLDTDEFDSICDHLIVEHETTGEVVGTYRLQTGAMAAANLGYYSEREFEFGPYAGLRSEMVELGRACIHRDHRSTEVLFLLWKGVVRYALARGGRYFIGCCSLTSQDPAEAAAVYSRLSSYQVSPELRTHPLQHFALPLGSEVIAAQEPPKLLRAYLALGAKICGPPAIDREFKTIDFLTFLDLHSMNYRIRAKLAGV